MTVLTVNQTIDWMKETYRQLKDNYDQLTGLDQAVGDGDHGMNMVSGFQEVVNKMNETSYESASDVLKSAAMTLKGKVGGTSGSLYGTAFLKMSVALEGKPVTKQAFKEAIDQAVEGLQSYGHATFGEKTLVDVWIQVAAYLEEETEIDWQEITEVCQATIEDTREMIATKGKAASLKEQTLGHVDPGSMSSFYLFQSLADVLTEERVSSFHNS
ncbi:dihydroxyacetone kinase subunit DhaL [Gracilibacillus halophilus YIM-C55.5]|uniref:phosphoenolpyruvate--glycerone phosphotransferase n=1 Tax=Gracilibacillus halophilus YIM-C55.5 TaxID=1308866 RepID=N4WXQ7_9BACI|nr:dihydroxyacetone kinase subunit DhaL [Gracilibacillus halophilus]ENH97866.1 dihydroxyacetone kinase subunit DhaL [Gracilibacillus halophilus YIM-C55.5]